MAPSARPVEKDRTQLFGGRLPAGVDHVIVHRSSRRRRTVSARREGRAIVVLVPAVLSRREEDHWVRRMVDKVGSQRGRRLIPQGDTELSRRAVQLASELLDEVAGQPVRASSVRWVANQQQRWGSCTPETGQIRLSTRLQVMPAWVIDYVLVHELCHLVETNHTARFHELVARYPSTERAIGFLAGWTAAEGGPAEIDESQLG